MQELSIPEELVNFLGIGECLQVLQVLDLTPGIIFWLKDSNGRVIHCNQLFIEHIGKKNLQQVIGFTDSDFSPKHIAKQFILDDKKVLAGESIQDRLEINITKNGDLAWYATSKRPIFNKDRQIVGTYGISRHIENSSQTPTAMGSLQIPVDYIKKNYGQEITIKNLASHCNLSISALERRFKKYLSKSPLQFINEFRLEQARRQLIESNESIALIASNCGYSEHSYFSSQFSKFFNELPSEFRRNHIEKTTA